MKKLFLAVIVTLFMGSAFAAEGTFNNGKKYSETYKELTKLLSNHSLLNNYLDFENFSEEGQVKVKIMINDNHEIVVMGTDAINSNLNSYIKNTLNYQKLKANELEIGKEFVFQLRFINN